jgi:hypothetical protein
MKKDAKKNDFFQTAFAEMESIIKANIDSDGELTRSVGDLQNDLKEFLSAKCKESFKNGIEVGKKPTKKKFKKRW